MPRPAPHPQGLIQSAAQVRALRSPTRQEIVDALESAGPCSAAELARLLARAQDALYFHLRVLLRVGLIIERPPRKTGRHVAAVYDLPARPLRLSYREPVRKSDVSSVVNAALRLSLRDFDRALRAGAPAEGPRRTLWGGRAKGWLDTAALERLNTLLAEAQDLIRHGRPVPDATPISLGFVLAPSKPARRTSQPTRKKP